MKRELSYLKEKFETNDTPREEDFSDWMDSYWHKDETINVEQKYKTISNDIILDDSFHNCIVRITGNAIITVPNNLRLDFNCVFDAFGNVSATFNAGEGTLFSAPVGKILRDNAMCTLYKYTAVAYRLNGGLTPA